MPRAPLPCGHFRDARQRPPTTPAKAWDFEDYAKWVTGSLETLRLDRPTLIGHSNSGGAALVAAATYPAAVGRLVLADTVGADNSPSMPRVLAGRAYDALLEPRLSLFGWHHVIGNALLHTRPFFGQVWKSVYADLRPFAVRVRAPTLIAWGAPRPHDPAAVRRGAIVVHPRRDAIRVPRRQPRLDDRPRRRSLRRP